MAAPNSIQLAIHENDIQRELEETIQSWHGLADAEVVLHRTMSSNPSVNLAPPGVQAAKAQFARGPAGRQ